MPRKGKKFVRPSRVCILTEHDVKLLVNQGVELTSLCGQHEHTTQFNAIALAGVHVSERMNKVSGKYERVYTARWVHMDPDIRLYRPDFEKFKAIIINDPREWAIRRSGGKFGMNVHQLVHVGY